MKAVLVAGWVILVLLLIITLRPKENPNRSSLQRGAKQEELILQKGETLENAATAKGSNHSVVPEQTVPLSRLWSVDPPHPKTPVPQRSTNKTMEEGVESH